MMYIAICTTVTDNLIMQDYLYKILNYQQIVYKLYIYSDEKDFVKSEIVFDIIFIEILVDQEKK